ncbi:hypothetical protein ACIQUQ_14115 [Streptomyces sp. NPDC101118]|uniref:hypothetical protein n=1 Tax=Streptomyces sp. NPDC101118 TaxID=3366109 RepID=UPI003810D3ED
MRLRTALTAGTAALVLVLSTAGSSSAAAGEFRYTSVDLNNVQVRHVLEDPASGVCIDLEGTANLPALLGRNYTDAEATLFQDAACEGDTWWVVNPGLNAPAGARFRSVVFSG